MGSGSCGGTRSWLLIGTGEPGGEREISRPAARGPTPWNLTADLFGDDRQPVGSVWIGRPQSREPGVMSRVRDSPSRSTPIWIVTPMRTASRAKV